MPCLTTRTSANQACPAAADRIAGREDRRQSFPVTLVVDLRVSFELDSPASESETPSKTLKISLGAVGHGYGHKAGAFPAPERSTGQQRERQIRHGPLLNPRPQFLSDLDRNNLVTRG